MGDLNGLDFVVANRDLVKGPILEVGSRDYGNTPDFRGVFAGERYVGVDQEPGAGVDLACDFTADYESLAAAIGVRKFGTVICQSVLEHCRDPFGMARNITAFLDEGGVALVSVPFVWNVHGFPDDYWRITPSALPVLFPECELLRERSYYSTKNRGERVAFDADLAKLGRRAARPKAADLLRRLGLLRERHPYFLFPLMVNGVLVRKPQGVAAR
jgi:SAM-dependent methyltransferase